MHDEPSAIGMNEKPTADRAGCRRIDLLQLALSGRDISGKLAM
jgi:hypothetical protein